MPLASFTKQRERVAMNVLRILGYVNLIALIGSLFSLKGPGVTSPLLIVTPLIALIGSAFYYLAWERAVAHVSKADGRRYMRPYLLGFYLLVAVMVLMTVLYALAGRRGA